MVGVEMGWGSYFTFFFFFERNLSRGSRDGMKTPADGVKVQNARRNAFARMGWWVW